MGEIVRNPHAPPHVFMPGSVYMVTAGTYHGEWFFNSDARLHKLAKCFIEQADEQSWKLYASIVLPNLDHFIGKSPEHPGTLTALIGPVHSITAKFVNAIDRRLGQRVWLNFWDTCIRGENDFISRMRYLHSNAVKHGIGTNPNDYPYSSDHKFVESSAPEFSKILF